MPAIRCKCGEVLRFGDIPNPIEWLMLSDTEFERIPDPVSIDALYTRARSALECPRCKRLWIYWNAFGENPEEYVNVRSTQHQTTES